MVEKLTIVRSSNPLKKYDAIFEKVDDGASATRKKTKTSFGAVRENGVPYTDYVNGADEETRKRYLARHRVNEDWTDYKSAGALSAGILWGPYRSIRRNINAFKAKHNLI